MNPSIPDDIEDMWDEAGQDAEQALAAQESADARQQRFEEVAVRQLLSHLRLSGMAAALRKRCKERTGQDKLLFSTFLDHYPAFPLSLYFQKIPFMHQVTQVTLFKRLSRLPLFKAFEEAHERDDTGKPVGLVFDWPSPEGATKVEGLSRCVIHNMMLPQDSPHTRFSRRFMTDPPQTVHIMQYKDLLEGLNWSP